MNASYKKIIEKYDLLKEPLVFQKKFPSPLFQKNQLIMIAIYSTLNFKIYSIFILKLGTVISIIMSLKKRLNFTKRPPFF